jgi:hypothetical protein
VAKKRLETRTELKRQFHKLAIAQSDLLNARAACRYFVEHVSDIADPTDSGRLKKHIPIGEHRVDAQRVRQEYLDAWGDLQRRNGELLKDGYIQLSGNPPIFNEPERFEQWFYRKRPEFVHANNI